LSTIGNWAKRLGSVQGHFLCSGFSNSAWFQTLPVLFKSLCSFRVIPQWCRSDVSCSVIIRSLNASPNCDSHPPACICTLNEW
jgi:hypothetical protein